MKTSQSRLWLWFVGLASLAGSAGLSWGLYAYGQGEAQPNAVVSQHEVSVAKTAVVCFGHVDAEQGVARLSCEQSGRIVEVLTKEGEPVAAGAPLLRLDARVQEAQLAQARQALQADRSKEEQARLAIGLRETEVRMQEAVLEAARDRLARVERELDRCLNELKELVSAKVRDELSDKARDLRLALRIEQERLGLAKSQVELARHEQESATSAVLAREQQVRQAEIAVEDCVLKAPFDGLVLRLRARPGELVGPAFPEPLVELCPDSPRIVRAEIAQEFAQGVEVGAACEITDDYGDGQVRRRGRVARVSGWFAPRRSPLFEPLQLNDARTLECIIHLSPDPTAGTPRIGQRMRVTIEPR